MTDPGAGADPPLLTLAVGNTTLAAALFPATGTPRPLVWRRGGELVPLLADLLESWTGPRPRRAAAVTVRPEAWPEAEGHLAGLGLELLLAGRELDPGVALDYDPPAAAGLDRVVAARAAAERYGSALVVDAGTAVTVDLVEPGPRFRGGTIAPGAGIMAAALTRECSLLPPVPPPGPLPVPPPRTTADAMRLGVYLGFAGLVDRLVEAMLGAAGRELPILATGGGAELWREHSRFASILEPHLVHLGLAAMAGS